MMRTWAGVFASVAIATAFADRAEAQVAPPYAESFDSEPDCGTSCSGACNLTSGWTNAAGDGSNWLAHAGPTPSSGTGPDADHTTGAGRYLYVETSGCNNIAANLLSPVFDLSSTTVPVASFWYHMLGATMGTMHVDVSVDGGATFPTLDVVPAWTGNTNEWLWTSVDLAAFAGQPTVVLRLRAETGSSFTSDMAIDDFVLCDALVQPVDLTVTEISPEAQACDLGDAEQVSIEISNRSVCGSSAATFDVQYVLDGQPAVVQTYDGGSIGPNGTATFTFDGTIDLSSGGPFALSASTLLADDTNPGNDTLAITVTEVGSRVTAYPALDDLEDGGARWFSSSIQGALNSWAVGTPQKSVINGASSGAYAWVTGGLAGFYNNNEHAAVTSRCGYDFSTLATPAVSLDVFWNAEFSWDGAQLQASSDGGETWATVGAFGDPYNWYTDNTISGLPGDQSGWTGRTSTSNGSTGWRTAVHTLPGLAGQADVLLRVRWGTDGSVVDEGFAFDDVEVFEITTGVRVTSRSAQISPLPVPPSSTNVLLDTLELRSTSPADEQLVTLSLAQHGSLADEHVAQTQLWLDDGNGVFEPLADTLLSTSAFAGGVTTFDGLALTLPAFFRTLVHVSADLGASAPAGDDFGTTLADAGGVTLASANPVVLTAAPISGPLYGVFGDATIPYLEDFDLGFPFNLAAAVSAGVQYPQATATGEVPTLGAATAAGALIAASGTVDVAGFGPVAPASGSTMMAIAFPGGDATGAFDLYFDASGLTTADDVWLGFAWNNANEEAQLDDGVFLSIDGGATWITTLYKFDFATPVAPAWTQRWIDLSQALADVGAEYSADLVVRFQAAGATGLGDDGLLVDDVFVGAPMRLAVERTAGVELPTASTDDVGGARIGIQQLTYQLFNRGVLPLTIAGLTTLNPTNLTVDAIGVGASVIDPMSSTTLTIDYTVQSEAPFSVDLVVATDDPRLADAPYELAIVGAGTDAEIDLQQPAGSSIATGDTVDLGQVTFGDVATTEFTVANLGTADLLLYAVPRVEFTNASNVDATVETEPSDVLEPSMTSTVALALTPTAVGPFSVDMVIASDDTDEDPYTITLTGEAIAAAEIDVRDAGDVSIASGSTVQQGPSAVGEVQSVTFTIANLGAVDLELTGDPRVEVVGAAGVTASVDAQPAATVAATSEQAFTVSYAATAPGDFTFTLTIASSDADEGAYTVVVAGTGEDVEEPTDGGGGCCQTGEAGNGSALVLALGVLLGVRRRRRR